MYQNKIVMYVDFCYYCNENKNYQTQLKKIF